MTTKQQERDILAQIAALIESAGPDSYIGMAFEGCVEMAESNIENDFGNSMKQAVKAAAANLKEAQETCDNLREAAEAIKQNFTRQLEKQDAKIKQLEEDLKAAKQKQLPADLYRDLWLTISQQEQDAADSMMQIASTLADLAGCPNDIAVKHGLNAMQAAKAKRDNAAALLERLEKYE